MNIEEQQIHETLLPLVDPTGSAPQQDPTILFSHMFMPKSAHIRGQPPPIGNPGSTSGYLSSKSQTLEQN